MGRGMAGGYAASGQDGAPADLSDVPNKQFVMLVAAFSAMGGLLFGYDTGINGGVKVSTDFVMDFCDHTYSDQLSKCSCYGSSDDGTPAYTYQLAGRETRMAEAHWGASGAAPAPPDYTADGNDEICVGVNPESGLHEKMWACDCFAPDANRVPPAWNADKGKFVSLLSFGAMVGALGAGQMAELLGRRKTISIVSAVFVLGTLVCCGASGSLTVLLCGRVLIGFPIGALSAVLPMYATEIAPKQIRGVLGTLFQLAIVVGILVATVVAIPLKAMAGGWIVALGIAAIPAAVLSVGIWRFPESPRWLLAHSSATGDASAAAASLALQTLRAQTAAEVSAELEEMQAAIAADTASAGGGGGYGALLEPKILRRLLLGVGLQVLQQATGVNAIFYFAPTIFADAKIGDPLLCAAATGFANLLGTLLAIRMVEEQGRRTLLMWGAAGMTVSMGVAAALLLPEDPSPAAGYTAVLFICMFVIHFAYSWGPMCWVYPAEIFPMHVKAKAVSITTCGNWVTNMIFGCATYPQTDSQSDLR